MSGPECGRVVGALSYKAGIRYLCTVTVNRSMDGASDPEQRPTVGVSTHGDDNLAFGSTLLEIGKRFLCLIERKHFVDHWPDATCL